MIRENLQDELGIHDFHSTTHDLRARAVIIELAVLLVYTLDQFEARLARVEKRIRPG
jgi:hypothetical protein